MLLRGLCVRAVAAAPPIPTVVAPTTIASAPLVVAPATIAAVTTVTPTLPPPSTVIIPAATAAPVATLLSGCRRTREARHGLFSGGE